MTQEQKAMMLQIQQLGFTMNDLAEYLDTHPYDAFAMQRYQMTAKEYDALTARYGEMYGTLVQMYEVPADTQNWQWAMHDFPWDH